MNIDGGLYHILSESPLCLTIQKNKSELEKVQVVHISEKKQQKKHLVAVQVQLNIHEITYF